MPTSVLIKGVLPVVPSWWALLRRRCGLTTTPRPWELQRFPADYESSSRCHQGAPRVGNGGEGLLRHAAENWPDQKTCNAKKGPKSATLGPLFCIQPEKSGQKGPLFCNARFLKNGRAMDRLDPGVGFQEASSSVRWEIPKEPKKQSNNE